MKPQTKKYIWGLVLFLTGVYILILGVESLFLDLSGNYLLVNLGLMIGGLIAIIASLNVLSKNINN